MTHQSQMLGSWWDCRREGTEEVERNAKGNCHEEVKSNAEDVGVVWMTSAVENVNAWLAELCKVTASVTTDMVTIEELH
jgi:hypothetical protein